MVTANTDVLLGRDERLTKRWGLGVVALLLASLVYFAAVKVMGYPAIHLLLWWEGYAVLLVALITVQAYSNGGVVMSWLLAFGAVVGVILNYGGIGLTGSGPGLLELIGIAILGGFISAVIIGTLGFGIGTVMRRTTT
jgi:hypothetical protein